LRSWVEVRARDGDMSFMHGVSRYRECGSDHSIALDHRGVVCTFVILQDRKHSEFLYRLLAEDPTDKS